MARKVTIPGQNVPVQIGNAVNPDWYEKFKFLETLQPLSDVDFAAIDAAIAQKSNIVRTSFVISSSQDVDADWVGNLVFVGGTITITIQPVSSVPMPAGTLQMDFLQFSAGTVQFAAGTGVTIVSKGSLKKLSGTGSPAALIYNGSDTWYLAGDLVS